MKKTFFLHFTMWLAFFLECANANAQTNYALDFDGVNDFVQFENYFPLHNSTGDFTIEFWVLNRFSNADYSIFWTRLNSNDFNRFNIHFFDGSGVGYDYYSPTVILHTISSGNNSTLNVWSHQALTRQGNVYKTYKDGQLVNQFTDNPDLPTEIGWTLSGRSGFRFNGQIDEIRFWNAVRTEEQIQQCKNKHLIGNETNLIGYWDFDSNSGDILFDKTASGNNGKLGNLNQDQKPAWVLSGAPIFGCISTPPQPADITYCQNASAQPLSISGTNLMWYTTLTGGTGTSTTPTPSTATVGVTSFFVTQNTTGCESARAEIKVTVTELPTAPYAGIGTFCGCSKVVAKAHHSATDFSPTRIYEWYDNPNHTGTPLPSSFESNNIISIFQSNISRTVYVYERVGDCYSPPTTVNLIILPPPYPSTLNISSKDITACGSATATASITNTANHIEWWTSANQTAGTKVGEGTSYTTTQTQTIFVFEVTDNTCNGSEMFHCYGVPMQINFTVHPLPTPTITNLPVVVCRNADPITLQGNYSPFGSFKIDGIGSTVLKPNLIGSGNHIVTYTYTTSDFCTSLTTQLVTITDPITFSPSTGSIVAVCETPSSYNFSYTVSGGSGTKTYQWFLGNTAIPGATNSQLIFPTGLKAENSGAYTLHVMDAIGCTYISEPVTIIVNANPTFTFNYTPILCNGQKTNLTITPTNGAANQFAYSIDGGTTQKLTNAFSNLGANTYPVFVAALGTGCLTTKSLTIAQPVVLSTQINKTAISCNGVTDGKILFSNAGGTQPYKFSLNGGAFQTDSLFSNLGAGMYNGVLKDANGCTVTKNGNSLSEPSALTLLLTSSTPVLCFGAATGKIVVSTSGGTGAKQYSKDGGATWQASGTFSNLGGGTYTVSAKDANSCTSNTLIVTLTEPITALTATAVKTDLTCRLSSDGAISIATVGGVLPYNYSVNNGGNYFLTNNFTALTAGTYSLRVKDANGCLTASSSVLISQPNAINFTTTTIQPLCASGSDGKIKANNPTGGNGAPYQFSLSGGLIQGSGVFQTDSLFTNVPPGVYDLTVRDAKGCSLQKKGITITSPAALTLALTINTNVLCFGAASGRIIVTTSGGTGTKQYSKDGGLTWQPSSIFSNLSGGNYTITAKDANGCVSNSVVVTLSEPPAVLSFTKSHTDLTCNLSANGNITFVAIGGTSPYNYSINNGVAYSTPAVFSGLSVGKYTLRVRDSNGCTTESQFETIEQPTPITFTTTTTKPLCSDGTDGKIKVNSTSGGKGAPYQFSLNGSVYKPDSLFINQSAGTYTILVKDIAGCVSAPKSVAVTSPTAIAFGLTKQDVTCGFTTNGVIAVTPVNGGAAPYKYSKNSGAFQSSNTFISLPIGAYTVQVKDYNSCLSAVQNIAIGTTCPPQPSPLISAVNKQFIPVVILSMSPNPTDGELILRMNSIKEGLQEFQFFDMFGRLVLSDMRQIEVGRQNIEFDVSALSQGAYIILTPGSSPKNLESHFFKF